MRYLILLILFVAKLNLYSQSTNISKNKDHIPINWCDTNSKKLINNSSPLKYKVFRIREIDKAYIIDIDIRDKAQYFRYTIISLKSEKQDLKRIKRGKHYEFILFAYFPFEIIGDPIYNTYIIDGISVGFKGDFKTGEIVTTPNLQGLYYMPPERAIK